MQLTSELASHLARIALSHVTREYPNKLDHVMRSDADVRAPRALHPVFYGSYDWHSCVHSWWTLLRLLRAFTGRLPEADAIADLAEAHFTPQNFAIEGAYLKAHPGFERPYGWAWMLKLQAAIDDLVWGAAARGLSGVVVERWKDFLPKAIHPIRSGAHFNTAFALALTFDYADAHDAALAALCREKARAWYGADRDAQAWEPSLDDFLSPALVEAECMRRALGADEFRSWFAAFLPRLVEGEPRTLFVPAAPSDRSDGKIAHLDGLNLSRAWCWRGLASALDEPARGRALAAAEAHISASLPHLADDYMGGHWLASFALLALDPM